MIFFADKARFDRETASSVDGRFPPFQIASARDVSYLSGMSKVEQIKAQIDALTWQERCELNALLQNWPEDDWEQQMASEGKFDRVMEEAEREYRAGQCREWPRA